MNQNQRFTDGQIILIIFAVVAFLGFVIALA